MYNYFVHFLHSTLLAILSCFLEVGTHKVFHLKIKSYLPGNRLIQLAFYNK